MQPGCLWQGSHLVHDRDGYGVGGPIAETTEGQQGEAWRGGAVDNVVYNIVHNIVDQLAHES